MAGVGDGSDFVAQQVEGDAFGLFLVVALPADGEEAWRIGVGFDQEGVGGVAVGLVGGGGKLEEVETLPQAGYFAKGEDGGLGDCGLFGGGIVGVLQVGDGFPGGDALQGEGDHFLVGVVDGFRGHVVGGDQGCPGGHEAETGGFVAVEFADQPAAGTGGEADVVE